MVYKIAICDDENVESQYILSIVEKWSNENNVEIKVDRFNSAEAFLFHYAESNDYDIFLLDIEMGKMDGVTLAKKIRKDNETVQIIFITGYSNYISEGYEVAALHYLMKPVNEKKLFEVLNRAVLKIEKNERVLIIEHAKEMVRCPLYEIAYLEVNQNYVTIHAKQSFTVKKTLKDFEELLDERFYRIGRSFIINLNMIERVTKMEVILSNGSSIPLPRGQYDSLNQAIIKHS